MSDRTQHEDDVRQFSFPQASRLLESVAAIGDQQLDLMERREALMTVLMHELDADCGLWSWGYGKPTDKSIIAVGVIYVGLTDEQRAGIAKLSFDAEIFQDFYCSIFEELDGSPRTMSLREEDFIDRDEKHLAGVRKYYADCGWGSWLQNARYFPKNAYSSTVFYRNLGRSAFTRREADLLELVCFSVSWLHANIGEVVPPEQLRKLTARQRAVLLMLLDGLPRKVIARQLGISEATVADHLTAIFECFEVSSAMELAALFLKNQ